MLSVAFIRLLRILLSIPRKALTLLLRPERGMKYNDVEILPSNAQSQAMEQIIIALSLPIVPSKALLTIILRTGTHASTFHADNTYLPFVTQYLVPRKSPTKRVEYHFVDISRRNL